MATRFYFEGSLPEYSPPTNRGTWTYEHPDDDCSTLQTVKINGGDAMVGAPTINIPSGVAGTRTGLMHKSVSLRLQPQTISGTFDMYFGAKTASSATPLYTSLHVYVVKESDDSVFATLINNYRESAAGGGTVWPTGSPFIGRKLVAPQAVSATIPSDSDNYRIVVEFGVVVYLATAATAYSTGGFRQTDYTLVTDIAVGDSIPGNFNPDSSNRASFIEFSADILLKDPVHINQSPETAIQVTSLPFSATVAIVNERNAIWYRYFSPVDQNISVLPCNPGTPSAGDIDYAILGEMLYSVPGIPPLISENQINGNSAVMWPLKANEYYFINLYSETAAPLNLSIITSPLESIQADDVMASTIDPGSNKFDDYDGRWPYVWYHSTTGIVKHTTAKLPSTNAMVMLSNGRFAVTTVRSSLPAGFMFFIIYTSVSDHTEIARIELFGNYIALGTDMTSFYTLQTDAGTGGDPVHIKKYDQNGVVDSTVRTVSGGIFPFQWSHSCAASRDGAILYFIESSSTVMKIRRYDLVNNVELSLFPLPPKIDTYDPRPRNVIVLADNTVVIDFNEFIPTVPNYSTNHCVVHYSAGGTILRRIDFGTYINEGSFRDYGVTDIFHTGFDETDKVWVVFETIEAGSEVSDSPTRMYHVRKFQLSTGSVLVDWSTDVFALGPIGGGSGPVDLAGTCNTPMRFGSLEDVQFLAVLEPGAEPPVEPPIVSTIGGIYYLNPAKATWHDSYYSGNERKIPNPTVRSALFGE